MSEQPDTGKASSDAAQTALSHLEEQKVKLNRFMSSFDVHYLKMTNEDQLRRACQEKVLEIHDQMKSFLQQLHNGAQPVEIDFKMFEKEDIPNPELDISDTSILGNEKFYISKYKADIWNNQITPLNIWINSLKQFNALINNGLSSSDCSQEEVAYLADQWQASFGQMLQDFLNR